MMVGFMGKRKELEQVVDGLSDFSLSSPATKSRRLVSSHMIIKRFLKKSIFGLRRKDLSALWMQVGGRACHACKSEQLWSPRPASERIPGANSAAGTAEVGPPGDAPQGPRTPHPGHRVKSFPKEDPKKACHVTAFVGYKAGMMQHCP